MKWRWCGSAFPANEVVSCKDESLNDRPFSRDARPTTVECPVCLVPTEHERKVVLESCSHEICFDCAQTLSQNRYRYNWCSKCPMCREPWTSNDFSKVFEMSKQQSLRVSTHDRLRFMIEKIGRCNEHMALACTIFANMDNVTNEEKVSQISAVHAFFDGKIDYAEMRRRAG